MKSAVNFTPESFLALMIDEVRPNREVMGRMEQAVPRYADPATGVLVSEAGFLPDTPAMGPVIPDNMADMVTERMFPGFRQRMQELKRRRAAGNLRGV